jgi:predicted RNA-binding Zn ribbon-like protein
MSDIIRASDFDPPLVGRQAEQVQEAINEALRRRAAQTPLATSREQVSPEFLAALEAEIAKKFEVQVPPQRKLKDYKNGESVDVIFQGEWVAGTVNGIDKEFGHVHVHTVRGMTTVASSQSIRPR